MSRSLRSPRIIPWGPYRGRRFTSFPEKYRCELAHRVHIDETWREVAQDELVRRFMKAARRQEDIERSHERVWKD